MTGFERFDALSPKLSAAEAPALSHTRAQIVQAIQETQRFDVVVVGAGIHGASMARLCAFNGLRTLLLERHDYAAGTSSRSSKMAHGGLRYLEMFDFAQVREGIKQREQLFENAAHLAQPHRFLVPVPLRDYWYRLKLRLGLSLYDLLCWPKPRWHTWLAASALPAELRSFAASWSGCYSYTDGILNDTRLVIETLLAARQEGALCLNQAQVLQVGEEPEQAQSCVHWQDKLSGERYLSRAGIVVNLAGAWAGSMGLSRPMEIAQRVRFSRGSHLLFSVPWNLPPLFLPLEGKARYYWIWPHFAGTLVGTTERPVDTLQDDPLPSQDEIEELLARLAKDVPQAGLTRSTLHYAFAGYRSLLLRSSSAAAKGDVSRVSRRHCWLRSHGMLSLFGGKLTTASATVAEGLTHIFEMAQLERPVVSLDKRLLPGAHRLTQERDSFLQRAQQAGISPQCCEAVLGRLGSRVKQLTSAEDLLPLGAHHLMGEVRLAIEEEQAVTLEDVLRRRLDMEYYPGHGIEQLEKIAAVLQGKIPQPELERQVARYRERMQQLGVLLRGE
jgi:glycerol-3-phosphate dehydrogenase